MKNARSIKTAPVMLLLKDADNAESLANDLRAMGYLVENLLAPELAMDQVRKTTPLTMIIEDRVARMTPLVLARRLRDRMGHHVPVIILSNISHRPSTLRMMRAELGLGEIICKPFSLNDLVKCLRRFCDVEAQSGSVSSITDYTSPSQVFYILFGRAIRMSQPIMVIRERNEGAIHAYIDGPTLVAITSTNPNKDRDLGDLLLKGGVIQNKDLNAARKIMAKGTGTKKKLGEILVSRGILAQNDLERFLQQQAELRLLELFGWRSGAVRMEPDVKPPDWAVKVNLDIYPLTLLAMRKFGDNEVNSHLLTTLDQTRLSIPGHLFRRIAPLANTQSEQEFLQQINESKTVSFARRASRIREDLAGAWLAFLIFIGNVKAQEKPMAATVSTLQRLRLQRIMKQQFKDNPANQKRNANRAFALGWKMMSNGLFSKAVGQFQKTLEAEPSHAKARACLEWSRFSQEASPSSPEAREALEALEMVAHKESSLGIAQLFLGRMYKDLGRFDKAVDAYMAAIEIDPGNTEAMSELRTVHQIYQTSMAGDALGESREAPAVNQAPLATPTRPAPPKKEPEPSGLTFDVDGPSSGSSSGPEEKGSSSIYPPGSVSLGPAVSFGLVLVDWSSDSRTEHLASSSSIFLDAETKSVVVQLVRSIGASLEEFSLNRLCAVLGVPQPVDDFRLMSAELALALLKTMKRAAEANAHQNAAPRVRVAIVMEKTPLERASTVIGEAVAAARRMLSIAENWQIIAPQAMYRGFENLVTVRVLPNHAQTVEVLDCLVQTHNLLSRITPALGPNSTPATITSANLWHNFTAKEDQVIEPGLMLEHYQIESLIGSGGMGNVYLATDVNLGRKVAVKVIRPEIKSRPMALRRFKREAQGLAKINSPNVTQIYALSLDSDHPYLVMEYVDGPSIYQMLEDRGIFSYEDAGDIALQVINGLESVYAQDLIHRDINPKNLLIHSDGTAKITDFGLVQMDLSSSMSATTGIVGTPFYMSPEQAQGRKIDFHSDLYSLAMTLYHMLTGHPPFSGRNIGEIITKHLMEPLPPLRPHCPDLPILFEEFIRWLATKNPEDRPQSYEQAASALRKSLGME